MSSASFWATLASVCNHFEHIRVTLETVWPVFKKHFFSILIFMILYYFVVNLEPLSGQFGALWGHFGVLWVHFKVSLRSA